MSCCCTKILDLCDVDVCDGDIDFAIKAQANGVHRLEIDFLGSVLTKELVFAVNDDIKFPAEGLNENFAYVAALYQPDGGKISVSKDDVVYDCFSFRTMKKVSIDE